jgi:hypothetical protein
MNFFEAPAPFSIAADSLVHSRVEVAVPAIFVPAKDDARNLPIRSFVKKSVHRRKFEATETEFTPQTDTSRNFDI